MQGSVVLIDARVVLAGVVAGRGDHTVSCAVHHDYGALQLTAVESLFLVLMLVPYIETIIVSRSGDAAANSAKRHVKAATSIAENRELTNFVCGPAKRHHTRLANVRGNEES